MTEPWASATTQGAAFETTNGVPEGADMTDQTPNRLSRNVVQLGLAIVAALAVVGGLASPVFAANFPPFELPTLGLPGAGRPVGFSAMRAQPARPTRPDLLMRGP